jgi:DnaD/phage-associated family protein
LFCLIVIFEKVAVVNPFNFYAQNGFGLTMNNITREKIVAWCNDLSDELVVHAMQIAMERNCVSWSYAEGILKKWHGKGVKTLQDVEALVAQFEAQQSRKNRSHGNQRTENVPEWFDKRQQEKQQKPPVNNEPIDFEAERAKVLAKLGGASNA